MSKQEEQTTPVVDASFLKETLVKDKLTQMEKEFTKLQQQNTQLQLQLHKQKEIMLISHELCWLFMRTPKCASQRKAQQTLPLVQEAIGKDLAEAREKEWRTGRA